jgi:hypothetical protein
MDWLRWHLGPHKAVIIAALIVAVGLTLLLSVQPSDQPLSISSGFGFGPEWECTPHPMGEPTCIKKIRP